MKYPFVKQDDLKDCAASSLLMIIKYYKGYISKVQLTDMLKTDKSGTSIYNLVEVAKYIGFDTKCGRTKNLKIFKEILLSNMVKEETEPSFKNLANMNPRRGVFMEF